MEFEEVLRQFSLLKRIIDPTDTASGFVDLTALENIIFNRIPKALEEKAPENFPQLYFEFTCEYERFREFILYDQLIGKNVVALGGGFSSGKSSFLNSLIGENILPAKINPSTSVPAYLLHGDEASVYGINTFHSRVKMEIDDVKFISHGFGQSENDREAALGHVLDSIFITWPGQPFSHIALLDTPGYSKAESSDYSAKTDEKIARVQLNSSNYILWFVQADAGTITEADLEFLSTLRKDIPKLIVVNKADKVLPKMLETIVAKIRGILDMKGLPYVDVLTYSKKRGFPCDREKIMAQLREWDQQVYESRFAYNFKVLFTRCREYYDTMLDAEGKRLNRLNKAVTLSENDIVSDCLNSLIIEIKRSIGVLKDCKESLKTLQDEFFSAIKYVGDQVNIQLPEPSEIDLLREKAVDPKIILESYLSRKGLRPNPDYSLILTQTLGDVKPMLGRAEGGAQYKETLVEIMEEALPKSSEKIKFTFIDKCQEELISLLSGQLR